jgi:hypothetical protein
MMLRDFTGRSTPVRWNRFSPLVLAVALSLPGAASLQGQTASTSLRQRKIDNEKARAFLLNANVGVNEGLQKRKADQIEAAKKYQVFHDFKFTDRRAGTGIEFNHQIVDDCGRNLKAIQYDHGTGLAVADVDGDGLLDLFFVNQLGGNALYRNLGNGKFEDITDKAGVGLKDRICVSASFGDFDNDGKQDLFVTTVKQGNVLFHNIGGGKFEDISKSAGVDGVAHSSGSIWVDIDNDGLLDLVVCNVGVYTMNEKGPGGYYLGVTDVAMGYDAPERREQTFLYKNLGGLKFKEVSKEMGLAYNGWSGDAGFSDVNGDGYPDLYILNMQGEDHFYLNEGGKRFVDKTREYFKKTPWGTMGIKFFDFNQDGRLDLYLTDMHSDMSAPQNSEGKKNMTLHFEKDKSEAWCAKDWSWERVRSLTNSVFGNAFYLNLGGGKYEESSDKLNAETYWPWGMSVGDVNADGYDDAFVTAGMGYPFRYGINSLLLNEGGKRFVDSEFVVGIEPRPAGIEKEYFKLDCSGADKDHALCFQQQGIMSVPGSASSRSSVFMDIDNDGDLDLITADFNGKPQVFISDLTEHKAVHFVQVKVTGSKSNRNGLGAVVKVTVGGRTLTQQYDGKTGYVSQSQMPLYFGLGDTTKADKIEVTWPSGAKQTVTEGLAGNKLIEVKE